MQVTDQKFLIVKKTTELQQDEIFKIIQLINEVFYYERKLLDKKIDYDFFINKYTLNSKGYSYHGMLIDKNDLKILYSVIPKDYTYFKKKLKFGLAVDTVVEKKFRGNIFFLKKLALIVYDKLKNENISFVYGFPNESIKKIRTKLLGWEKISRLNNYFYINKLPFKKNLFLNSISFLPILFNWAGYYLSYLHDNQNISKNIILNDKNKLLDKKYKSIKFKNFNFTYSVVKDLRILNNQSIVYLIDIFPWSKKNLSDSIKKITEIENDFILIFYTSNLNFNIFNMYKIPKLFSPINFEMYGRILDHDVISNKIFNNDNWNVNFTDFDIR